MRLLAKVHAIAEIAAMGIQTAVAVVQTRRSRADDEKDARIAALEAEVEELRSKRRR